MCSSSVLANTSRNFPCQTSSHLHLSQNCGCNIKANVETDEVYAQMTSQPLSPQKQKDVCLLPAELGISSKQPTNSFCKTLTTSGSSTHGGPSVHAEQQKRITLSSQRVKS